MEFFDKRLDVVEAIRSKGLVLDGALGATSSRFFATTVAAELGTVDLALVLVEFDGDRDNRGCRSRVPRRARLRAYSAERHRQLGSAGGPARPRARAQVRPMTAATVSGRGARRHTNLGPTIIGEIDGVPSERAREIAWLLKTAGLPVEITDNVQGHIWSKFVHNCAINPVSAVTRLDRERSAREGRGRPPRPHPRRGPRRRRGRGDPPAGRRPAQANPRPLLGALQPSFHVVNEAIVLTVKALEVSASQRGAPLSKSALEQLAQRTPRGN